MERGMATPVYGNRKPKSSLCTPNPVNVSLSLRIQPDRITVLRILDHRRHPYDSGTLGVSRKLSNHITQLILYQQVINEVCILPSLPD